MFVFLHLLVQHLPALRQPQPGTSDPEKIHKHDDRPRPSETANRRSTSSVLTMLGYEVETERGGKCVFALEQFKPARLLGFVGEGPGPCKARRAEEWRGITSPFRILRPRTIS